MLLSNTASGVSRLLMSLLSISCLKSGWSFTATDMASIRRCMVIYRDTSDVEIVQSLSNLSKLVFVLFVVQGRPYRLY